MTSVEIIIQRPGGDAPGSDAAWQLMAGRPDVREWAEKVTAGTDCRVTVSAGSSPSDAGQGGDVIARRVEEVTPLLYGVIGLLEAEQMRLDGRPVEAFRLASEFRTAVDVAARSIVRNAIRDVVEDCGGNASAAGRRLGMTDVAVGKWLRLARQAVIRRMAENL
ncbi:hypothetical protein [Frankia sp. Cj3]|uniref:hypothetical protein n=1 Tax=Frankia sp. Cj3 TaxID=2880976 RepID=UPI001EF3DD8C|nr:hypothetical protein [Frankia sp. Cj3]